MKIKVKISNKSNMEYFNCAKDATVEVELEDYIGCVVASEIGKAPLEACKAQAVAARTFAVARGVLEGKAISDDASKAQAYIAKRNNYDVCNQAAKETTGEVLMYGGKYIGAYFSHSNGGRTYSCEEVWGSKRPYLIARKDAWTLASGVKKNGHGIGLSQAGAKYAASNDVKYREILSFYYPYTTLKKIEMESEDLEYHRRIAEEIKVRLEIAMAQLEKGL